MITDLCVAIVFWHMMIDSEWENLRRKNSPRDIFILFAHYFQLNLEETSFIYNEGGLRVIGGNDKPRHEKNCSDLRFSITVLWVGSAAGVNGLVIFLVKGKKVHQRLRGDNLVTKYVSSEVFCVVPKKSAYMDDKNWATVLKVVAPGIRKIAVGNVAFFSIFYSLLI